MAITISSPDLAGGTFPPGQTCDGGDRPPSFGWQLSEPTPSAVRGWLVEMTDPDAPGGTFTHWVLYGIPPEVRDSAAAVASGQAGRNSFGSNGYRGPCPPAGQTHHYHLRVLALDTPGPAGAGRTREAVDAAVAGHIIAAGELVATYKRS